MASDDITTLLLVLFAIGFSLVTFYIQKTLGQRDKVKQIQKQVNAYQKELLEAQKNKDEAKTKELMKKDVEMMKLMQDMMLLPLKAMLVILPLFWISYAIVLPTLFPDFFLKLSFNLPRPIWIGLEWRDYLGVRGAFIYTAFVVGLILEFVVSKFLEKPPQSPQTPQSQQSQQSP